MQGFSQSGGENIYEALTLAFSSRVGGIGGINVSHYDNDLNFVMQNPSLLRKSMSDKLNLNYFNFIKGVNAGSATFAKYFDNKGIFAAGIMFVNYGKIKHTDYTGIIYNDFVVADYTMFGSYSYKFKKNEKFQVGTNFKFIFSDYWHYSSVGFTIDLGASYIDTVKNFSAGLVISNLGTELKPYTKGNFEKVPFDIAIGFTKKFEHAPIRISVTAHDLINWKLAFKSNFKTENVMIETTEPKETFFNKLEDIGSEFIRHFVFGVEIVPHQAFHIDIGFNTRRRMELVVPVKKGLAGFSAGFGLDLKKFNFGYSVGIYHIAGLSHNISIGINFANLYKGH